MKDFFHIGYPKAASTTLQKQMYDRHSEIDFYGIYPTGNVGRDTSYVNDSTRYLQSDELRKFHDLLIQEKFDADLASEILNKEIVTDSTCARVFSSEWILSTLFCYPNIEEKLKRIKLLMPEVRIIIVLRNQMDFLISQYRDQPFDPLDIQKGEFMPFEEWMDRLLSNKNPLISSLAYNDMLQKVFEIFGRQHCQVLFFEDLKDNKEHFSRELSAFMGVSEKETFDLLSSGHENIGASSSQVKLRSRLRALKNTPFGRVVPAGVRRWVSNLAGDFVSSGEKLSISCSVEQRARLNQQFLVGNESLFSDLDCDFKESYRF